MDDFVLGQAALLGFVGLSILTVCVGFTVRVFLGPVLRDVAGRLATSRSETRPCFWDALSNSTIASRLSRAASTASSPPRTSISDSGPAAPGGRRPPRRD